MAGITDFIKELIRPACDINGDGKLDTKVEKDGTTYDEVSIFNRACESYNEEEQTIEIFENGSWTKWSIENLIEKFRTAKKEFVEKLEEMYGKYVSPQKDKIPQISAEQAEKIEKEIRDKSVEKADATYVTAKAEAEKSAEVEAEVQTINKKIDDIRAVTLQQEIKRFKLKNRKYAKTLDDIPKSQQQNVIDRANINAKKIYPMVIELCNKYEIEDLAPVIADMLGNETGGYVFNKRSMNPAGKKYKGVMQVDFLTCQCIFSEGPQKNKDWHKKHFSQDDARIEELRKKYKTAQNLYNTMKTDVKLGLEVGIIAYKAKLHQANGNVAKAVSMYCGGQYKYPFDNAPSQFNVA